MGGWANNGVRDTEWHRGAWLRTGRTGDSLPVTRHFRNDGCNIGRWTAFLFGEMK
jgi:hypothetical protein